MRILAVLMVLFLVIPMLVAQGTADDNRIYDEVRRKLANDADVRGAGIGVTVKSGDVVLTGQVRTEKAKEKATTITKKIKGVKQVDNKLSVLGA